MKKKSKRALVPKLRFPEFEGTGEWEEKKLGELTTFASGGTPSKTDPKFWDGEIPWISASAMHDTAVYDSEFRVTPEAIGNGTRLAAKGSILILVRGSMLFKRVPICIAERDVAFNQDVKSIRPKHCVVTRYLLNQLIASESRIAINATGIGAGKIDTEHLKSLIIGVPSSAEQQKIADCLASLDDLIAAQAAKIETLKAHKKGLMQQLFPREGETTPRLRFPEFEGAGEWCVDSLGTVFDTTSGGTPYRSREEYWNGNIPWITTSLVDSNVITEADEFISDEGLSNSSAKLLPEKTILIAMYGQGKTRGKVALLGIKATTNQACAAILPREDIDQYYVFIYLVGQYDKMRELSNLGGQKNLSQGLIKGLQFSYPNDINEQRTIADCLSSLDDLIAAQAAKIETLKTHKKGLMQQLFPTQEVN